MDSSLKTRQEKMMVKGFIAKLSKGQKTLLYVSALIVTVAFLDRVVLSPLVGKMKSLEKQIKEAETDIKKNNKILGQRKRIEIKEKKYASLVMQVRSDDEETAALLREIQNLASTASVYLVDLKPSGIKTENLIKKFMVNINCEGQMDQIVSFMYSIENSDRLLQVAAFSISPKSRQSSVARCELLIYKIVVP